MDARPNILLLQSDEHSYRFLSARQRADGGEPCSTPNLDALIQNGTHFSTDLLPNAPVLSESNCHALRSPLPSLWCLG